MKVRFRHRAAAIRAAVVYCAPLMWGHLLASLFNRDQMERALARAELRGEVKYLVRRLRQLAAGR